MFLTPFIIILFYILFYFNIYILAFKLLYINVDLILI